MSTEMAKTGVDFSDVTTKLRERIQAAFVDLIPQDKWDEMLQKEVEKFMAPAEIRDYHGRVTHTPSPFSKICQAHLDAMIQQEVAKQFAAMNHAELAAKVSAWVEENHQAVLVEFAKALVSKGVEEVSARISYDIATMAQSFLKNR
jgi:hypothetical protein